MREIGGRTSILCSCSPVVKVLGNAEATGSSVMKEPRGAGIQQDQSQCRRYSGEWLDVEDVATSDCAGEGEDDDTSDNEVSRWEYFNGDDFGNGAVIFVPWE